MSDALKAFNTRRTPQTERADSRQVENSAGGYSFAVDDLSRLRRFLILGTDGGSYYASQAGLTRDNAEVVIKLAAERPLDLVNEICAVSQAGRAPKNDQALFALALAAASPDVDGRRHALAALPLVARTGTHLFQFLGYLKQFRGVGSRGVKRAVGNWYLNRPLDDLAYQMVKYRQREGWTHRDALRLTHPLADGSATGPTDPELRAGYAALFDWACGRQSDLRDLPLVAAYEEAKTAKPARVRELIAEQPLSWEMLRDDLVTDADIWEALWEHGRVPTGALLRQLPRLTKLGLLEPLASSSLLGPITARLTDTAALKKARVHPLTMLTAHLTYVSGAGRGSTWSPVTAVTDALDAGFYAAFGAVEPTGKRLMLNLDVSSSMTWSTIAGSPLTPRSASAALALVTANVETTYETYGFSHDLAKIDISPRMRLTEVISKINRVPMGMTDCALPMVVALRDKLMVDTFVVYTDSETYVGRPHPHQALRMYREKINPDARLIVVGMVANEFTIADPTDAGMLDVVGFDTATPDLISSFARGDI